MLKRNLPIDDFFSVVSAFSVFGLRILRTHTRIPKEYLAAAVSTCLFKTNTNTHSNNLPYNSGLNLYSNDFFPLSFVQSHILLANIVSCSGSSNTHVR